jgi:hypothetical protein
MTVYNFAFPVVEGQEDKARKFAEEATGTHRDHYDSLMKASGTTRVSWTLQYTPAGAFILVWYEAVDPQAIFEILATGTGDDAAWMRGRIKDVGGVDMATEWPPPGPQPELILEWPV